jgi:hypothetical protein
VWVPSCGALTDLALGESRGAMSVTSRPFRVNCRALQAQWQLRRRGASRGGRQSLRHYASPGDRVPRESAASDQSLPSLARRANYPPAAAGFHNICQKRTSSAEPLTEQAPPRGLAIDPSCRSALVGPLLPNPGRWTWRYGPGRPRLSIERNDRLFRPWSIDVTDYHWREEILHGRTDQAGLFF